MPPESSAEDQDLSLSTDAGADVQNSAASSSTADDKDGKEAGGTLLERFDAALKKSSGEDESSGSQSGTDKDAKKVVESPDEKTEEDEDPEAIPDGDKPLTAKSAKKLVKRITEANRQLEEYKPQVESFQKIIGFCNEAGLAREEVNKGFEIMAAMKSDPLKAMELLKPYWEQLMSLTGSVLPADLQERVSLGQIDEATAQELARVRAEKGIRETQLQRTHERSSAQIQEAFVSGLAAAADAWQRQWEQSDPDYKVLFPYVNGEIELALRRGQFPKNPDDAAAMCESIKKRVVDRLKKLRAPKPSINPDAPGSQHSAVPQAPKSMLEAVQQGLAKTAS